MTTTETLARNRIHEIDVCEGLRRLPDGCADVVVADPPYNIGKDFGVGRDDRELAEYLTWSRAWIDEATRVLADRGTMFIYGFSEILAHLFVGIELEKRWLVWHYTNKNVPSLNFWQRSHESLICCWKGKPRFNRDAVREPYTETFLRNAAGRTRKGTPGRFSRSGATTVYAAHHGGALPRDVLKVPALAGGAGRNERWFLCRDCDAVHPPAALPEHETHAVVKHPTQKPLALSARLIRSAKPADGGLVLVPFAGCGSECVAARRLGLDFVGFELNPEYIRLAKTRLASDKAEPGAETSGDAKDERPASVENVKTTSHDK